MPATTTTIHDCSPDDLASCFTLLSTTFNYWAPFIDIFFPEHDTPAGAAQGTARLRKWQASDPHTYFLRASRPGGPNGDLVGFAIWTFMPEAPPAELDQVEDVQAVWGQRGGEAEVRFAKEIWRSYVRPRSEAVREAGGKGVFVLEMMAVHPNAQGCGVGAMLMRWGMAKADEKGLEAVVEATPNARRLYEKCGFRTVIEEMRFDVSDEFANRKKPKLIFLTRQFGVQEKP